MKKLIFIIIAVVFSVQSAWGGEQERLRFERISTEHGLSQASISSILQDRRGFLWFGTMDGLNRYDGYSFTVYKHDPEDENSLCMNSVWSLAEDGSGNIWIGTPGGLSRLDTETGKITCYPLDPDFAGISGKIPSICVGRNEKIWFGIFGGGLCMFDPDTEKFIRYADSSPDRKTSMIGVTNPAVSSIEKPMVFATGEMAAIATPNSFVFVA